MTMPFRDPVWSLRVTGPLLLKPPNCGTVNRSSITRLIMLLTNYLSFVLFAVFLISIFKISVKHFLTVLREVLYDNLFYYYYYLVVH